MTAGYGFATTELRLQGTTLVNKVSKIPHINFKLYVDDSTISSDDKNPRKLAWRVAHATDVAVAEFRREGLEASRGKSAAIASSVAITHTIVALSKAKVLKTRKSAKLLGVGYTGGRSREAKITA